VRAVSLNNMRILLVLAVLVATATMFWSGSRYPSLNEKAIMGGSAALEDPLSFEASLQTQPGDPLPQRILFSTVNWVETNLEGMTFGLVIGACLLTLIGLISVRGHRNGYVNSALGVLVGTPLGVCVNCAAPVAKGMHDGGARLETTLATMFSSPTLNIVVVSMLLSIFPPYLVVIKLTLTLVFILLVVPWLSRRVFSDERALTYDDSLCAIAPAEPSQPDGSLASALFMTGSDLIKNLWYVVSRTVPLMLLAGALGAVAANLLPLQTLVDLEPTVASLVLVALVGIFLPVPVAFDIVVVAVLISTGVPMIYSMTLLFTLGIFSIYPFMIVWRSISAKVAIVLTLVLIAMGIAGGVVADRIHQAELQQMMQYLEQAQ
jgi:uncharacterized membrane protein YraQ (UPF0718 family)